jgi:hypothetical protein
MTIWSIGYYDLLVTILSFIIYYGKNSTQNWRFSKKNSTHNFHFMTIWSIRY